METGCHRDRQCRQAGRTGLPPGTAIKPDAQAATGQAGKPDAQARPGNAGKPCAQAATSTASSPRPTPSSSTIRQGRMLSAAYFQPFAHGPGQGGPRISGNKHHRDNILLRTCGSTRPMATTVHLAGLNMKPLIRSAAPRLHSGATRTAAPASGRQAALAPLMARLRHPWASWKTRCTDPRHPGSRRTGAGNRASALPTWSSLVDEMRGRSTRQR